MNYKLMMKFKQKTHAFIFSLLLHVLLLLLISLHFHQFVSEVNDGENTKLISSYVYQQSSSSSLAKAKATPASSLVKAPLAKSIALKQQKHLPKPANKKLFSTFSPALANKEKMQGNGKPIPELIAMLHAAIQKQQQYPATALQMEREGSVTLRFTLFPNGTIQHLKVIKPSGTMVLDEAAINAVNHALPFPGVEKFIRVPDDYQITVKFELT